MIIDISNSLVFNIFGFKVRYLLFFNETAFLFFSIISYLLPDNEKQTAYFLCICRKLKNAKARYAKTYRTSKIECPFYDDLNF